MGWITCSQRSGGATERHEGDPSPPPAAEGPLVCLPLPAFLRSAPRACCSACFCRFSRPLRICSRVLTSVGGRLVPNPENDARRVSRATNNSISDWHRLTFFDSIQDDGSEVIQLFHPSIKKIEQFEITSGLTKKEMLMYSIGMQTVRKISIVHTCVSPFEVGLNNGSKNRDT